MPGSGLPQPSTTDDRVIPLVDLQAQYREIADEVRTAIDRVLQHGQFVLGPDVAAFEQAFAAYCGVSHAFGTNSGTSALHLALLAAGIGPGDEVITVPFTFVATVAAVGYAGARAVLVDIDPRSYTIDVNRIEAAITPATRAIMPVHLYGQPADMDPILEIARRRNLVVIEDAAQAHGAEYKGKRAGSIGHIGCFSFYPGKNLGAYGEGGMVVTNDPAYARKIRMLRDWGQEEKDRHVMRGYNYRMEGIQGAILGVKLRHLERWTEARRSHARRYSQLLAGGPVETPQEMPYTRHVYHVYGVRSSARDRIRQALAERSITTRIHYPIPVHLQEGYADLGYRPGDFPCAEKAAAEELSLPMYPELTEEQLDAVVRELARCAE
jgi:dTDP-4-amino-4,6-dideoxygalactose transaminase